MLEDLTVSARKNRFQNFLKISAFQAITCEKSDLIVCAGTYGGDWRYLLCI